MKTLTADTKITIKRSRPALTGDTKIRLSQITDYNNLIQDKHSKYRAGDRAIWKDGIHEKMPNGRWKKIEGMSKPLVFKGTKKERINGKLIQSPTKYTFDINKKDFQKNKNKLLKQIIVKVPEGSFTSATAKEAKKKCRQWIAQNIKEPVKTEIGPVEIVENSMDTTLGHLTYPAKLDSVKAIKPILENGVYLGELDDLDGNDLKDFYFAGKIKIGNSDKIVFCRVRRSESDKQTGNRFYLHSVYVEDNIKKETLYKSDPGRKNGQDIRGVSLEKMLMQNFINCKS